MMGHAARVAWADFSEAIPAFLALPDIPLSFSIADDLALVFISYPLIKLLSGRVREVRPIMIVMAVLLTLYFVFVRARLA